MKAVVTGASKGIGKAIKKELEKEGIKVIDISRTSGYNLMDGQDLERAINEVKDADILINNFGGGGTWCKEDYWKVMDNNYYVMMTLTNEFVEHKNKGRVITISSIYGKEKGENPGFCAAKSAQIAYMKSMAGKYNKITFNTICPGHIDVGKPFPDNPKVLGKPKDVANLVVFLCSDKARHINGATITVDGGESHSF